MERYSTSVAGLQFLKSKPAPSIGYAFGCLPKKKRLVRTTKTRSKAEAIKIAEELLTSMGSRGTLNSIPKNKTFRHFAEMVVQQEKAEGSKGIKSSRRWSDTNHALGNSKRGLLSEFGDKAIDSITTQDYRKYFSTLKARSPSPAPATLNRIASTFSKIMKSALDAGAILAVPATPRFKRKDNPRPFFLFYPLVNESNDQYKHLLEGADKMAQQGIKVRGVPVTLELRDIILFLIHSFLRPTEGEIYSLTHRDIVVAQNPKRLNISVARGKTGNRISTTMEAAVTVYARIKKRHKGYKDDDFLFLPDYKNRSHVKRIFQRQFSLLLKRCGLSKDRHKSSHSLYSLRHTAICMRLVLSEGQVNIFNLAKNAGTSVEQIERFYARHLPQSAALAKNLHTFGSAP